MLQLLVTAEQRQLIDQAAAAEGTSRIAFMLRSCQERAREVLLDRTLFSLTPQECAALLNDLQDHALVHAIDEQAAAFYRSLGFRPSPSSDLTLMLQLGKSSGRVEA